MKRKSISAFRNVQADAQPYAIQSIVSYKEGLCEPERHLPVRRRCLFYFIAVFHSCLGYSAFSMVLYATGIDFSERRSLLTMRIFSRNIGFYERRKSSLSSPWSSDTLAAFGIFSIRENRPFYVFFTLWMVV